MIAGANGTHSDLDRKLHSEVRSLIRYITRLREEIARIAREQDDLLTYAALEAAERLKSG